MRQNNPKGIAENRDFQTVETADNPAVRIRSIHEIREGKGEPKMSKKARLRETILLSFELRERFWPTSFYTSEEYWAQIVTMVAHTLDLNRTIFLECVAGSRLVREIQALNCSIQEMGQKERDSRRPPYSQAIEAQGPIRLSACPAPYSNGGIDANEDRYLVPLVFADEVLGFWAFGVDRAKAEAIPMFEALLRDYSEQIGELLYHRNRATKDDRNANLLKRYFISEQELDSYEALVRKMERIEHRLVRIKNLLNEIDTATIVYNLLGEAVEVNASMLHLLKREGFAPYGTTVLDLISTLTGNDLTLCRNLLRQVIIENRAISLPVTLSIAPDPYTLRLDPVQFNGRTDTPESGAPLRFRGILCELANKNHFANGKRVPLTQPLQSMSADEAEDGELSACLLGHAG